MRHNLLRRRLSTVACGRDGIEPVLSAALAAAGADAELAGALQRAADAASLRTNANAETVADAIIIECMSRGAPKPEAPKYSGRYQAGIGKQKKSK